MQLNPTIPLNMNAQVKCKLTESGKAMYSKHMKSFSDGNFVKVRVPEELTLSLADFSYIFGQGMYMGNPALPFTVDNQIEVLDTQVD